MRVFITRFLGRLESLSRKFPFLIALLVAKALLVCLAIDARFFWGVCAGLFFVALGVRLRGSEEALPLHPYRAKKATLPPPSLDPEASPFQVPVREKKPSVRHSAQV